MHQTMTTKDSQDRGTTKKKNSKQHPLPEQSGFTESKTGFDIGEGDVSKVPC